MHVPTFTDDQFVPNPLRGFGWANRVQALGTELGLPEFTFALRYPLARQERFAKTTVTSISNERYAELVAVFEAHDLELQGTLVAHGDLDWHEELVVECKHSSRWRLNGQVLRCDRCGCDGT